MIKARVRGLDGFRKDLEIAKGRLTDGVRDLMSELADEAASDARNRARSEALTGRSTGSIKAMGPVVRAGDGVPWYGFADFGGTAGVKRSIKRKYIKGGRWLFPAVSNVGVAKEADETIDKATKELQ